MIKSRRFAFLQKFFNAWDVPQNDMSALDLDEALGGEMTQHACHDLTSGIYIAGDLLLRDIKIRFAMFFIARDEVRREALIETLEQHLLDDPYRLRIPPRLSLEDELFDVDVARCQT